MSEVFTNSLRASNQELYQAKTFDGNETHESEGTPVEQQQQSEAVVQHRAENAKSRPFKSDPIDVNVVFSPETVDELVFISQGTRSRRQSQRSDDASCRASRVVRGSINIFYHHGLINLIEADESFCEAQGCRIQSAQSVHHHQGSRTRSSRR